MRTRQTTRTEPAVEICGKSDGGEGAFDEFMSTDASFVTVDIALSGHGLSLIERIHAAKPSTRILVISMFDDDVFAERAIAAGSLGYVSKQATISEIINAFRTVRCGQVYRRRGGPANSTLRLSNRELQILCLLGNGGTTLEIAISLQLAVSTVETYRERLKKKLSLASNSELIYHATLWVMQNASARHASRSSLQSATS
jgi:DNA-binding NarL/FixJ family response regulator